MHTQAVQPGGLESGMVRRACIAIESEFQLVTTRIHTSAGVLTIPDCDHADYHVSSGGVVRLDLEDSTHYFAPHVWSAIHDWDNDD